ncbi:TRAP transporter small permease [Desulfofustis glycolicus]|uniref:TRAP-type C4-dicarboxylate transport system, small permease component n=1 Tax=Desulfofustis glycolicus DSM 9705 TaxID=1121409 RepID=A0A1M5YEL1_9BACT|nr:TRAP transporter small permease [Desulfofustis glycolicus]MCB2216902.1 TRAP transporter small permease [Desulfobulbaceae bacterium]SHI10339.1 TRAP-type C4-dicarboxylate transport system, small permease component [Desulfofustis glycolicus DSM 9705]
MDRLKRTADWLTVGLDVMIASFFAIIVLITILQVILRYAFNASVLGGGETMEALFIYTTAIGAAAAVRRRQHINISFVVDLLPVTARRVVDGIVHLLIAFLNGVMIYYSIRWIGSVGSNESPVLRLPEWMFQLSIPIGCGLVILYCLVNTVLTLWGEELQGDERC